MEIKNVKKSWVQKKCRICFSEQLYKFLDLGMTGLADRFLTSKESDLNANKFIFPLAVNLCKECGWHQLTHTVNPKVLYENDYPYDSRTTDTGENHWEEFASSTLERIQSVKSSPKILDIGSNTGALLSKFKNLGCEVIGIDPSLNAARIAKSFGIKNIVDFFGKNSITELLKIDFRPDIIVATNSFAHADDIYTWLLNVKELISKDGILVIESPHALELFRNLQYDTVYHEHLSYLSLKPLSKLLDSLDLAIFNASKSTIHGGSLRIFISAKGRFIENSVGKIIGLEENEKIFDSLYLDNFALQVEKNRSNLSDLLSELTDIGSKIGIVSAPAKGMTYYAVNNLSNFNFLGISDKNPMKIGKYAPGTNLKVISDEELIGYNPDYLLVLAWNFKDEIIKNMRLLGYKNKFIVAIPTVEVVHA